VNDYIIGRLGVGVMQRHFSTMLGYDDRVGFESSRCQYV